MHATMPRPVPVPPVAVLRSMLGLVAALAAGGLLVFLVVGAVWWAIVAGATACACGVVVGSTEHAALALALGLVATSALVIALGSEDAPGTQLAFPARQTLAPPPVDRPVEPSRAGLEPADRAAPARTLVRSYYAAIDAGDFERAWARLAPEVRASFGGLEAWRAGYATTVGHELEHLRVEGGVVKTVLVAVDRTSCGGRTERRFAVTWRLERSGKRLRAAELRAEKLGGVDPAAAC